MKLKFYTIADLIDWLLPAPFRKVVTPHPFARLLPLTFSQGSYFSPFTRQLPPTLSQNNNPSLFKRQLPPTLHKAVGQVPTRHCRLYPEWPHRSALVGHSESRTFSADSV